MRLLSNLLTLVVLIVLCTNVNASEFSQIKSNPLLSQIRIDLWVNGVKKQNSNTNTIQDPEIVEKIMDSLSKPKK